MIDKNGIVKLADFGLARTYQEKTDARLTNRVITLWYRWVSPPAHAPPPASSSSCPPHTPALPLDSACGQLGPPHGAALARGGCARSRVPSLHALARRPPELLLGAERYGPEVDMWSVGCIFAELLVRLGMGGRMGGALRPGALPPTPLGGPAWAVQW